MAGAATFARVACSAFAQAGKSGIQPDDQGNSEISVHGRNPHEGFTPTAGGTGALSPISNHGGPVLGSPTVYLI